MKQFLDEDFLLNSKTAERLYHEYAEQMPIIDYHCHLPPAEIAANHQFSSITEIWLNGDHYKWRAMRANGVNEQFITGPGGDREKFQHWAVTVPYTWRNPLFHWTHLELKRYFGISKLLDSGTADEIYELTTARLQTPEHRVRELLKKMRVELICTTDDPIDSLEHHRKIKEDGFEIRIFPAFRPDKALAIEDPAVFNQYLEKLESCSGISILTHAHYLDALKSRHDFFHQSGCCLSDHGLEELPDEAYTEKEIETIFNQVRSGNTVSKTDVQKFKVDTLLRLAEWDHEKGWVQQFHLGALRNTNSRLLNALGPDTGFDSIGDFSQGRGLCGFLNRLDKNNRLAKTILYNLNPADNELMATMTGNYNDGTVAGKIQWGSAWWFLDQKDGMIRQMNALSNMGLISRFVGMVTDSRSFLSYPRHEYFRRILCSLIGTEIEQGELPNDIKWAGKIVQDVCYHNAKNYFNWNS
ncbi:MAG TPA: glucuronate isomerase [Puia sp.]|nr:glucuronate isomerase [Puia sp.]